MGGLLYWNFEDEDVRCFGQMLQRNIELGEQLISFGKITEMLKTTEMIVISGDL